MTVSWSWEACCASPKTSRATFYCWHTYWLVIHVLKTHKWFSWMQKFHNDIHTTILQLCIYCQVRELISESSVEPCNAKLGLGPGKFLLHAWCSDQTCVLRWVIPRNVITSICVSTEKSLVFIRWQNFKIWLGRGREREMGASAFLANRSGLESSTEKINLS